MLGWTLQPLQNIFNVNKRKMCECCTLSVGSPTYIYIYLYNVHLIHMLSYHKYLQIQACAEWSIFSARGILQGCFLLLCILRSLDKSYLFNNSVQSISCLRNNHTPSLDECATLLLKATDRRTHKKPDITHRQCKLSSKHRKKQKPEFSLMFLIHCNLLLAVDSFRQFNQAKPEGIWKKILWLKLNLINSN